MYIFLYICKFSYALIVAFSINVYVHLIVFHLSCVIHFGVCSLWSVSMGYHSAISMFRRRVDDHCDVLL